MFSKDYKWHYDYVQLAQQAGFFFENHKSYGFDKGKICLVDIERVVNERDFITVENFIPNIIEFILDSEQTHILDESFVKTFRLGQLAIEYLIFCKKYLDNTVKILKKELSRTKDENKELHLCVDDLKDHISCLVAELKEKTPVVGFKCEECSKIFSTEEFLNAHKNRRHTQQSDKLQHEIKELKGRLNSAEQLLLKDNQPPNLTELHKKIDDMRLHLHSELKVIEAKHDIEEKYSTLLQKLSNHETTTQTSDTREKENNDGNVIVEALEKKVSTSLEKIEMQIQSVMLKVQEIENNKKPQVKPRTKFTITKPSCDIKLPKEQEEESHNESVFSFTSKEPSTSENEPSKSSLKLIPKTEASVQSPVEKTSATSISEVPSPRKQTKVLPEEQPKVPLKKTVVKQKIPKVSTLQEKGIVKASSNLKLDAKLLAQFRKEIEKLMRKRLEDLGISPDWKGLPRRTFEKAVEMVHQQAKLMKKTFPDFDRLSSQLEVNVSKLMSNESFPNDDTDSESESMNIEENATKGVLKSDPSKVSLAKKKVLFNLQPETKSGSSTSITSSVLDAPSPKPFRSKIHEILSDSD